MGQGTEGRSRHVAASCRVCVSHSSFQLSLSPQPSPSKEVSGPQHPRSSLDCSSNQSPTTGSSPSQLREEETVVSTGIGLCMMHGLEFSKGPLSSLLLSLL